MPKLGEICEHGQLRRQCNVCEPPEWAMQIIERQQKTIRKLQIEIERLRYENQTNRIKSD